MNFSIFDSDGGLGDVATQLAVYRGNVVLPLGKTKSQVANELRQTLLYFGFPVESVSIPETGVSVNPASWTIKIRIPCLSTAETDRELRKGVESLGLILQASGGTSHILSSSVERRCSLVNQASTFTQTVNSGQLATVNVPISFDDDPASTASGDIPFLDTLKGLDTTTWVLIAVAGLLVIKRL